MPKPLGFIIYQGPSALDGSPIVAIATGFGNLSKNAKTGAMVQTYILRADVHPVEALKTGQDVSICGTCPHRPKVDASGHVTRTCYVNVAKGVSAVYGAFQRGRYVSGLLNAADAAEGRMVRLGTYGDPAAVPANVWHTLTAKAQGHTGYTHQWRNESADALRGLCLASADSAEDRTQALAAGWRTFRVRHESEALQRGEVSCPASEEAGRKVQCEQCRACSGADGRKGTISIIAHGQQARRFIPIHSA